MTESPVLIAGGGIGGLATALTLHQIGVPCIVFEAVRDMRPLGVGINLQPNAVRELHDLGIAAADLAMGITSDATRHFAAEALPDRLPPKPLSTIGANVFLRWKEWRAAAE